MFMNISQALHYKIPFDAYADSAGSQSNAGMVIIPSLRRLASLFLIGINLVFSSEMLWPPASPPGPRSGSDYLIKCLSTPVCNPRKLDLDQLKQSLLKDVQIGEKTLTNLSP